MLALPDQRSLPFRTEDEGAGLKLASAGLDAIGIVNYSSQMLVVRQTDIFRSWLQSLNDARAIARIAVRIDRLAMGNPGDVRPVGSGISEMRIHYGPGYRVYFVLRGAELIILLCGGDKSTQSADIARARHVAKEV